MIVTQVTVTENGFTQNYAAKVPAGVDSSDWLKGLARDLIMAEPAVREIDVKGTGLRINRRQVTAVNVTMATS